MMTDLFSSTQVKPYNTVQDLMSDFNWNTDKL